MIFGAVKESCGISIIANKKSRWWSAELHENVKEKWKRIYKLEQRITTFTK